MELTPFRFFVSWLPTSFISLRNHKAHGDIKLSRVTAHCVKWSKPNLGIFLTTKDL